MNSIIKILIKLGILNQSLDYHLIRASTVTAYWFFGYLALFSYDPQASISYIGNGPLRFAMVPVFGVRGASCSLGAAEWLVGALLLAGFWNKKLGVLGAIASTLLYLASITILPFIQGAWTAWAGRLPPMATNIAFVMVDLGLMAVSIYLLRQDVMRVSLAATVSESGWTDPGELERLVVALQLWASNNRRTVIVPKEP